MTTKKQLKFRIVIDTSNSAFEEFGQYWEIAAILRDTANKLQAMEENRQESTVNITLRDHNGNGVGYAKL